MPQPPRPPDEAAPAAEETSPGAATLEARLGAEAYARRVQTEAELARHIERRERRRIAPGPLSLPMEGVRRLLGLPGLRAWGLRNARDLRVETVEARLPHWPEALDGLRLLQLSDLHLDLVPELAQDIARRLEGLEYDVAVVTGDFRNALNGPTDTAVEATRRALAGLRRPVYAILGNHDTLDLVAPLERDARLHLLLNAHVPLEHRGQRWALVGVDDPYTYQAHDYVHALRGLDADCPKILLLHAPVHLDAAVGHGFAYALCGHTHGGQICLPGGHSLLRAHVRERWLASGPWNWNGLHGYTSRGTGCCVAPFRCFCPPEITLHHLRSAG